MSAGRTRARKDPVRSTEVLAHRYSGSQSYPIYSFAYSPYVETTEDELHPTHPYAGGPFENLKAEVHFSDGHGIFGVRYKHPYTGVWTNSYVEGSMRAVQNTPSVLPTSQKGATELYGAAAWAKYKPTKPRVSLGQTIAEARTAPLTMARRLLWWKDNAYRIKRGLKRSDGVKTVKGASAVSGGYLSWEFGWKPFLSDLCKWYDTTVRIDHHIAKLRDNNGAKSVKRGGPLYANLTSNSTELFGGSWVTPTDSQFVFVRKALKTETVEERVWFDARFRYYIPGLDDPKWGRLRAISALYGLDVGPSLAYELMPWSWLIDWHGNLGNLIGNLEDIMTKNLAAEYAYVMRSTDKTIEYTVSYDCKLINSYYGAYVMSSGACSSSLTFRTKTRVVASPFGFGLSGPGSYDSYQMSILAALGLSRLNRF